MSNVANPSLIYTLGMLRFPRIPDMERFSDKFLSLIRDQYPLDDNVVAQGFNAEINVKGIAITPQSTTLWQFASADRKWAFLLSNQALWLHTDSYHDFSEFCDRFKVGIMALCSIPSINIELMTAVGLRHVNMIEPTENKKLSDYLLPWIWPAQPANIGIPPLDGVYLTRYLTEYGELRVQSLYNPPYTLPPELNSSFIQKNNWYKDRPERQKEFALVDIDHSIAWESPRTINAEEASVVFKNLEEVSQRVFNASVTPNIAELWRVP